MVDIAEIFLISGEFFDYYTQSLATNSQCEMLQWHIRTNINYGYIFLRTVCNHTGKTYNVRAHRRLILM